VLANLATVLAWLDALAAAFVLIAPAFGS